MYDAPVPLGPQHKLDDFDCGKLALNDWLIRHARMAAGSGSAKTFVVAGRKHLRMNGL
jgi:hypothetical protein